MVSRKIMAGASLALVGSIGILLCVVVLLPYESVVAGQRVGDYIASPLLPVSAVLLLMSGIAISMYLDVSRTVFLLSMLPLAMATILPLLEKPRDGVVVGTIVSSALPADEYLKVLNSYQERTWVEANGSKLPAGSRYGEICGCDATPDLTSLGSSMHIVEVVSNRSIADKENIETLEGSLGPPGSWVWHVGFGEVEGHKIRNYENQHDKYRIGVEDDGTVVAKGWTHNYKAGNKYYGPESGTANAFGMSLLRSPIHYYIKIN